MLAGDIVEAAILTQLRSATLRAAYSQEIEFGEVILGDCLYRLHRGW